jgi:hypothetical protein
MTAVTEISGSNGSFQRLSGWFDMKNHLHINMQQTAAGGNFASCFTDIRTQQPTLATAVRSRQQGYEFF